MLTFEIEGVAIASKPYRVGSVEEMEPVDVDKENAASDEPVPPHLRPLEEKQAAIAEFRTFCDENIEPGSLSSLYLKERRALRKIFPGTLVDLGRQGIVKVRAFGNDGWYDVQPDQEADSRKRGCGLLRTRLMRRAS